MSEENQTNDDFEAAFDEAAGVEHAPETLDAAPDEPAASATETEVVDIEEPSAPDVSALQAELASWQHKYKSDIGRVTAWQRQAEEAKGQVAQMHQRLQEMQNVANQPSKAEVNEAMRSPEKWKAFAREYPEFADPIKEIIGSALSEQQRRMEAQFAQVTRPMAEIQNRQQAAMREHHERQQQAYIHNQYQELSKLDPAWNRKIKTQEFKGWLQRQAPGTRALADSPHAADALTLIRQYDASTQAARNQARQARLQRSAAAPGSGTRATPGSTAGSFESWFDTFANTN